MLFVGEEAPQRRIPQGSTVLSVSFGSSVEGAVFQLEDGTRFPARVVEWVQDAADDGRFTVGPDNIKDRG